MKRIWRALLIAILIASLFTPASVWCAAKCHLVPHTCCAGRPQMVDDCCSYQLSSVSASAVQNEPTRAFSVTPSAWTQFASLPAQINFNSSTFSKCPPVHQAPPIVLRT